MRSLILGHWRERQYEQESSGSAGDKIVETYEVYSRENYSSHVWSVR